MDANYNYNPSNYDGEESDYEYEYYEYEYYEQQNDSWFRRLLAFLFFFD